MKKFISSTSKLFIAASLILSSDIISAQAPRAQAGSGKMKMDMASMTDTGFIRKNIMDNMMEIRLSEIGRDAATSDEVRALAEQMISDHTGILNDLTTLGEKMGVASIDTTTMGMPLSDRTPSENFDITWVNQMLLKHQTKVKELQMAGGYIKDPTLKALAASALPKIKMHTDMLSKLATSVKKAK